ncbi:MAG TPA: c-type cytochrome biogenesis protein CcmI, partial [Methylibium sp.]|nr:c-type cytochrome biogenesis protein CcmI [Methylibium sp.]
APAAAAVRGTVRLAPALAARAGPDDTVFVFARAAEGPRMPLAIRRYRVAELPVSFTLDDSLAMSPQMKLSSFARVVVGARVSKSGQATPQPGDLVAEPLPPTGGAVELVIDRLQP